MGSSRFFDFLFNKNDKVSIPLLCLGLGLVLYRNNLTSVVVISLIIAGFWGLIRILTKTKIFAKDENDITNPSFKRKTKLFSMVIVVLVTIIIITASIALNFAEDFGGDPQKYDSPNYKDDKFVNLQPTEMGSDENASFWETLGQYMKSDDYRSPNIKLPSEPFSLEDLEDGEVSITWLGHSTIFIRSNDVTLITDPVFGDHGAGPLSLGPRPFAYENTYSIEQLPEIDYVFISHDHYDHLDMKTAKYLKNSQFFVPLGVKSHLLVWGIDEDNIQEFDWYDEVEISSDLNAVMTPARHFSGRGIFNGDSTLWASWVLNLHDENIYFSGDTGYMEEFAEIGERYGPFDIAFLESGQYNIAWKEIHMMPDEVVKAGLDLKADVILPIHNSKYELALHRWDEPLEKVSTIGFENNLTVATPLIGQNFVLGDPVPMDAWWRNVSMGEQPFLKENSFVGVLLAPMNIIAILWVILPRMKTEVSDSEE